MQRHVLINPICAGKTAWGQEQMDKWLIEHPGTKALVIDPKTGRGYTRQFVPNPRIGRPCLTLPSPRQQ